MNKIVITGGTGLIGSAFKKGKKLGSKDYDLRSTVETNKMFEENNPDVVIHTAAKVGGVGANMQYPANFYYDNIMMNTNIIQSSFEHRVKKLVCFLSTCVFPDKIEYPLTEDKIHQGEPHPSNASYAYAKRMADIQIKAYNKQYETNYFSVIPCNVYGIKDNFNLHNGHVIPTLIHKCWLAKQNTQEYSIKEVVDIIIKHMEFEGEVKWLLDKPNGQHRKPSSNERLTNIIGQYNFTTLEIGLKNTIDWFKLNYETIRK